MQNDCEHKNLELGIWVPGITVPQVFEKVLARGEPVLSLALRCKTCGKCRYFDSFTYFQDGMCPVSRLRKARFTPREGRSFEEIEFLGYSKD